MAGLLLGVFGTVVCTGVGGVGMYYSTFKVKEAAYRSTAANNLKQVGLGHLNYHDTFMKLPAPDNHGLGGAPKAPLNQRLSWRVTILPYVEQGMVFMQFDQSAAWDAPKNKDLAKTKLKIYADPEPDSGPDTRIRVFVGPKAVFQPGTPNQFSLPTIQDGVSNTILAVEAGDTVPWPQYKELPFDPNGTLPSLGRPNESSFMVLYFDGHVQLVKKNVDPKVLKAAITPAGGEPPLLGGLE
jgi:prepilin-type processing-associated H-X9-DG protein